MSALPGEFNRSAQHLLDEEVAHGDVTDMVHGGAEVRTRWKNGQSVLAISLALERRNKIGVRRIVVLNGGIAFRRRVAERRICSGQRTIARRPDCLMAIEVRIERTLCFAR